ncbi:MAG: cysteine dioxygenase family protein [Acidobacteriota bacterium]|nr:cysteine dioxygenase family protein [Acidobacteriota bacterium]
MAGTPHPSPGSACKELVQRLDRAVGSDGTESVCRSIKKVLVDCLDRSDDLLARELLEPSSDGYARRLLHKDPGGRYSAVVMVWGPGQGTPLHDHAGRWCVEGVYKGRIRVTSYQVTSPPAGDLYRFSSQSREVAGRGEAGMLIPPHEFHTIDNPFEEPAATLHIYSGELTSCHVFVPTTDGQYRRERRELSYS